MTNANDFDRVLADWLDDGPRRAPQRPVDLAVEHCHTHPRRRALLGFLWSDVMSSRRASVFGMQPIFALLTIGLLTVAFAGALVVGAQLLRDRAIVVPPPSPSPTAPPPSSAPPTAFDVDLELESASSPKRITVIDASGHLTTARSGTQNDVQDVDFDTLGIENIAPDTLAVTWLNCPSDTGTSLTIDATGRAFRLDRGVCTGDTVPLAHVVILTFDAPVEAGDIAAAIVDPPQPRSFEVQLDLDGGAREIGVIDPFGLLLEAASGSAADAPAVTPGALSVENADPRTLVVAWVACPAEPGTSLTLHDVDPRLELIVRPCAGDAPTVTHVVILTFAEPVSASAMTTRIVEAEGTID